MGFNYPGRHEPLLYMCLYLHFRGLRVDGAPRIDDPGVPHRG
ncbi:conserved hypothetical protein [Frankia sp. Hr75.2]|nr:conserved hypothetical protein [Frankia sp. Hr75.2]